MWSHSENQCIYFLNSGVISGYFKLIYNLCFLTEMIQFASKFLLHMGIRMLNLFLCTCSKWCDGMCSAAVYGMFRQQNFNVSVYLLEFVRSLKYKTKRDFLLQKFTDNSVVYKVTKEK